MIPGITLGIIAIIIDEYIVLIRYGSTTAATLRPVRHVPTRYTCLVAEAEADVKRRRVGVGVLKGLRRDLRERRRAARALRIAQTADLA